MPLRSFGQLALFLVLIFAVLTAGALFPWQPLDSAWQWRLSGVLLNVAFLPLLALVVLQIGVALAPADPILKNRHRLFRQLAVAACLGFLLLLPLQFSAGLRQHNALGNAQLSRISGAETRLAALRSVTVKAASTSELNSELQKLQGPVLGPADLAHPLPLLKAQVNAVFDQAQIQINRDRAALPAASATTALPDLLRNALLCLGYGGAFAALARRQRAEVSLLEELRHVLRRLNPIRLPRSEASSQAQQLRRLGGDER